MVQITCHDITSIVHKEFFSSRNKYRAHKHPSFDNIHAVEDLPLKKLSPYNNYVRTVDCKESVELLRVVPEVLQSASATNIHELYEYSLMSLSFTMLCEGSCFGS